jgi:nifR3 family TIM-barrel protein
MRGAGAGMLRDIPKMLEMTKRIVDSVKIPVTVKTRLGWDFDSIIIEELAEQLQDVGIKALTIHGRTRSQLYTGTADWSYIGKVKNNRRMKIPIIGNGDITNPEKAKFAFDNYGVDAIMIGRATIGRPYIFNEIKHFLHTCEILPDLTITEKVELAKKQLLKSVEWKGNPRGIYEMRRQFITYFKGLPNFKEFKTKLITSLDLDEIFSLFEQIKRTYEF